MRPSFTTDIKFPALLYWQISRGYNQAMHWVFLSPHFDDIALSCGGLAWELSQSGQRCEICTVCSGPAPAGPLSSFAESLHTRWETGEEATEVRKKEDQASCEILGVTWHYLDLPDCIYRPGGGGAYYYASEESLFAEVHPAEAPLVSKLAATLQSRLSEAHVVVSPLTLGGHVDHRLTRRAADELSATVVYYADYPYRLQEGEALAKYVASGWKTRYFRVSEEGLAAWQEAVAAHTSQISTFWASIAGMKAAIRALWEADGQGVRLWLPPNQREIFP
jgi:LmbE family N-acetylglucosaminyl deacetylase